MSIENEAQDLMDAQVEILKNASLKPGLYSLKDVKLGKFAQPFVAPNDELAKRCLAGAMLDDKNAICQFAEDFQLFKLGNYDEKTGELISNVVFLANAIEFKNVKKGE